MRTIAHVIPGVTVWVSMGAASPLLAQASNYRETGIVGRYTYEQKLPGNGVEKGTVDVSKSGQIYKVVWTRSDGPTYSGVGIRRGDQLSICYSYQGDGERGVEVLTISPGPKLQGEWSVLGGDGKLYPDVWTPALSK